LSATIHPEPRRSQGAGRSGTSGKLASGCNIGAYIIPGVVASSSCAP